MPEVMNFPAARAAADNECDKLKNLLGGNESEARNKADVIREEQNKNASVHFGT